MMLASLVLIAWCSPAVYATGVPFVTLNNGVHMPVVAAGSWQYDNDTAAQAISAALSAGFQHIDTAHDYCGDGTTGDCKSHSVQIGVGAALKSSALPRNKVFVTTKVPGCGAQGTSRENCAADSVAAAEDNLNELGLEYVDLLLVHFPPAGGCGDRNCPLIREQWTALSAEVLAKNKTRALGVSNFCLSCFECLLGASASNSGNFASVVVPAVNQIQFHVGMGKDPGGLISYCKEKGVVVEAYSPLGDNTTELVNGELTSTIGRNHNKSSVQVALRWIWQNGVSLTTKSTKISHLKEDIDLFSWNLTADEMAQLDASSKPSGKPSFMCES